MHFSAAFVCFLTCLSAINIARSSSISMPLILKNCSQHYFFFTMSSPHLYKMETACADSNVTVITIHLLSDEHHPHSPSLSHSEWVTDGYSLLDRGKAATSLIPRTLNLPGVGPLPSSFTRDSFFNMLFYILFILYPLRDCSITFLFFSIFSTTPMTPSLQHATIPKSL